MSDYARATERRLSKAFDDAVMGHFVDHLSRDFQPKGCDVTVLNFVHRRLYSRTRAECVKTCTRTMIDWVCAINSVAPAATRRRMRYCER